MEAAGVKDDVRRFWEATPCGTRELTEQEGSREFFDRLERERDAREPFIPRFARFDEQRGREVLEVGLGAATDFIRFARAGAKLSGVDLTEHAIALARRRLELEGLSADIRQADAEHLPFADASFDFVYSWGVIHHTPSTERAAQKIVRVTRPGGSVCVMIYHRRSLVALQCWIVNALLRGRPQRTLTDVIARHIESAGTKAYTIAEARALFAGLSGLRVTPVVTPYDVRITRSRFAPAAVQKLVPARLGWFLVVEGRKP
jgi:ubiquinone/menaquinone biosynthesis C-methylase UbiE